ncbi:hypothetical protein [Amycolatopsis kentuckyensis]|uniref:hypothetical protein n=1 Tax=Amycolatopsis kentuckyensis TaxID=218823 RepID=UPI0035659983
MTVCAAVGSSAAENLRPYLADLAQLVMRSAITDRLILLLQGRTTPVSADRSLLLGYLPSLGIRAKIVGPALADTTYGLAVALEYPELADAIDGILERSYSDGRYRIAWRNSLGRLLPEVATGPPVERMRR